jgi:hypothetical protein
MSTLDGCGGSDYLKLIDFRHMQSSAKLREFQVIVVITKNVNEMESMWEGQDLKRVLRE